MICKDFLLVNIKELINTLSHKNFNLRLSGENDPQLEETLQVLELCQDTIKDGTYDEGYDCGYEQAKDEYEESNYDEGWSDCKGEVISILRNYGVTTKDVPDLGDL